MMTPARCCPAVSAFSANAHLNQETIMPCSKNASFLASCKKMRVLVRIQCVFPCSSLHSTSSTSPPLLLFIPTLSSCSAFLILLVLMLIMVLKHFYVVPGETSYPRGCVRTCTRCCCSDVIRVRLSKNVCVAPLYMCVSAFLNAPLCRWHTCLNAPLSYALEISRFCAES